MPPAQRFNGLRFFLTYSQADGLSIDDVADHLHQLADGANWLEIVQEDHQAQEEDQEPGIHYHVVLCFDGRFQGPLDSFDVNGYHPNWAPIRNATVDLTNRRHYIRKGLRSKEEQHTIKAHKTRACDYIIEPDTRGDVPPYSDTAGRLNWAGVLENAKTERDFLDLVRLHQPKDWILRNDSIVKYAATYYKEAPEPDKVWAENSWVLPPELVDWQTEVFSEVSLSRHVHTYLLSLIEY